MMYQRPKEHGVQVFIGGMMVDETSDVPVKAKAKKPDVVDVVDDHGQDTLKDTDIDSVK